MIGGPDVEVTDFETSAGPRGKVGQHGRTPSLAADHLPDVPLAPLAAHSLARSSIKRCRRGLLPRREAAAEDPEKGR